MWITACAFRVKMKYCHENVRTKGRRKKWFVPHSWVHKLHKTLQVPICFKRLPNSRHKVRLGVVKIVAYKRRELYLLQHWRRKHYLIPKYGNRLTRQHGVITQEIRKLAQVPIAAAITYILYSIYLYIIYYGIDRLFFSSLLTLYLLTTYF
jgi:hypothetical protein